MANVIITGASGLIGSQICIHLEQRRHKVYSVDVDEFDLRLPAHVEIMFNRYDDAGVLINCFAYNDHVKPGESRGTVLDLDLTTFEECMHTNVTALFSVCQEFARRRIGRGGTIINFGASTGIVSPRTDFELYGGGHKSIVYSVSKAAVIHMTKILATHLVTLNPKFKVNCISPGGICADQSPEFQAAYGRHTPSGRMGHVAELMPIIDMLLDPHNTYMIGANIVVDGGWTVQ